MHTCPHESEPESDTVNGARDELFEAMVEHARDVVLLMRPDGSIIFANAAAESAYACSRDELTRLTIRDLRAPETHRSLSADMRRAAGPGVLFETVHLDRRGRSFPVEVSAREVVVGDRRFLLSFIRDVSARVERLAEREQLVDDLELANRQLEGLLSIVSHAVGQLDIDTMLAGVMVSLREVMGARASLLFLKIEDGLVLRSCDGMSDDAIGYRLGPGEGLAGRVAETGEPHWTPDVRAEIGALEVHDRYGFRAMYGVPLRLGGALFGVLECAWDTDRLVSDAERVMLQVAADRVVSAIAGAQRFERTARAQRLDAALHLAADRLNTSHDLQVTIPAALEVASDALGCDVACYGSYRDGTWRPQYCEGHPLAGVTLDIPAHPERTDAVTEAVPVVVIDADHPAAPWLVEQLGVAEAAIVPVVLGRAWVGAMVFGRSSRADGFDDLACDFARRLSATFSLALANADEYDAEHRIAETLQEALLRVDDARIEAPTGHLYHAATKASRVGGDFYDIFELPDGRLAVLIGDVSGKGLEAAVFTTLVKHTVRAFAHEEASPHVAVSKANRVLSAAARLPDFASLVLFYLDMATGEAVYCCAGHPPPLVRRAAGGVEESPCGSPVVGAFAELEYAESRLHLDAGDVVVFYTDGATDARGAGGEFFGDERLHEAVRLSKVPAPDLPAELHQRILAFSDGVTADDIAIIALGMPVEPDDR